MMTPADQATLVHVGPGTRMGNVMRRYWHPIATSEQLPHPDCAPLRAKLLGETFVVFRDTNGEIGVLDERCPHRGISLALGRVEGCGIRCLYHSWKFAVDGTLLETPNTADPRVRERIKQPSFPVREQSGLIWTYIGPPELQPPLRRFGFDMVPANQRAIVRVNLKVNYLQNLEGGVDSSHVGLLHSNQVRPEWRALQTELDADLRRLVMNDEVPRLEVESTPYGFHYAASRASIVRSEDIDVRVVPVVMPTVRIIPQPTYTFTIIETPNDDENTSTYFVMYMTNGEPLEKERHLAIMGLDDERFYSAKDCAFRATWEEDAFFQDRSGMAESWTGFRGVVVEDDIVALSCAPYADRTRENLVAADQGVTRLRRRLLDCVRLVDAGESPLAAMTEDFTGITGATTTISATARWQDLVPDNTLVGTAEGTR